MTKQSFKRRERQRGTTRGSAIVEYVVATSMTLGTLLLPLGNDNRSALQRVIEAIQHEHAGYLYAASVPSLPRGSIAGSDVPAQSTDGPDAAPATGPSSSDPPAPQGGEPSPSGGTGGENGSGSSRDGGAGDEDPASGTDVGAAEPADDESLDPETWIDEGTDGDTGNGDGSCPLAASADGDPAANDALTSASQRTQVASTQVGNPIQVITGNKYQREVDVRLPGLHLAFVRHYNSRSTHRGTLGVGWTHGFDLRLLDRGDHLVLWQADGRRIDFNLEGNDERVRRFRPAQYGDGLLTADRGGYEWHWRDRTVLGFDRNRRLRQIRDPQGRTLRLSRDDGGHLSQLINEAGDRLSLHHDARGRIETVSAPGGVTARYAYDGNDNLVSVSYADRDTRRYHYDDPNDRHNLTGISVGVADGVTQRIKTWAYDAQDRGVSYQPASADGRIELVYEAGQTTVLDADQRISRYFGTFLAGIPVVTRIEGPGCSPCQSTRATGSVRYEYDENANLVGVAAADGGKRRYERDILGRIVQIVDSGKGTQPAAWLRLSYWRDTDEVETLARNSVKPDAEHAIRLRYRDDGQIEERIETGFAPLPDGGHVPIRRSQRFTYAGHQPLAIGAFRPDTDPPIRMSRAVEDGTFEMTFSDQSSLRVLAWDTRGRPRTFQASGKPALDLHYGPTGNIESVTSDRGRLVFDYDVRGKLAGIRRLGPSGSRLDLTRPSADSRAGRSSVSGEAIAWNHHRPAHRSVADARGTTTTYGIDDFGRRVFTRSPDSGLTLYDYDEDDRLRSKTTASGATATFVHDAARRLEEIRMADGATRFDWTREDPIARVSAIHDSEGIERTRYDDDGHVIHRTDTVGARRYVTEYGYAGRGLLEWKRLPDGRVLEYRYRTKGSGPPELSEIVVGRGLWKRSLISRIDRPDHDEHIEQWTAGNGVTTALAWTQGRLQRLRIGALYDFRYGYDIGGRIVRIDDQETTTSRYRFDAQGRLDLALTPFDLIGYGYDANGNRTRSVINGHAVDYRYAHRGNRLAALAGRSIPWLPPMKFGVQGVVDESQPDRGPAARFISPLAVHGTPPQDQVSHTPEGQVETLGPLRFAYNANGQVADVWRGTRHVAHYRYNTRAQRVAKQIPGVSGERQFLYEDGRLAGEADADGRVQIQYLYLGRHPVAMLAQDATYFIHANHLGAPIAVTDSSRTVIWRATYTPFGRATIDEDPDRNGHAFTLNLRLPGQYEDTETGLHYNHHRYYDPDLGRYLSPDPLGLVAGPNPYVYAGNDPVNHVDPTGLLLFAFDGTGNNDPPLGKRDISNVVKFRESYLGDPGELGVRRSNGTASDDHYFYISGAGTTDARTGISGDAYYDALTGSSMIDRVAALADDFFDHMAWLYLNHQKSMTLNVDTIGFSRGAAQARVFTNLLTAFLDGKDEFVLDHSSGRRYDFSFGDPDFARKYMQESCVDVNLRFMALFDTVPHYSANQLHLEAAGISQDDDLRQLDLGVGEGGDPNTMDYVAHAVAANEDRQGFHAISIHPHPLKGNTESRMEKGFIGAHADIGGGYSEGDLSDVALMWMVKRAEAAGVLMSTKYSQQNQFDIVTRPVIHDSKDAKFIFRDGRIFKYMNGVDEITQKRWYDHYKTPSAYGMDYELSKTGFFNEDYRNGPYSMRGTKDHEGNDTLVGLVDGNFYAQWLVANYDLNIRINESGLDENRRPPPTRSR